MSISIAATPPVGTQTTNVEVPPTKTAPEQKGQRSLFVSFGEFSDLTETKILNKIGLIPFVGTATCSLRGTLASAQFALGLIGASYHVLAGLLSSSRDNSRRHYNLAGYSIELVSHSICNSFRSGVEFIPFVSLFTALPYDLAGLRYSYSQMD